MLNANVFSGCREFGEQQDSNNEEDTDVPSIPAQIINVRDELHKINNCEIALPNHYRCCAHTLSLLITSDVENVPRWSFGTRTCFTKTSTFCFETAKI